MGKDYLGIRVESTKVESLNGQILHKIDSDTGARRDK